MTASAGNSREQREAETWLIRALSRTLKVRLTKKKLLTKGGSWLEVDGYCQRPLVLCEAWAHIGAPRPAQQHKVMSDALRLLYANKLLSGRFHGRRMLLFADADAAKPFQGKSWMAHCLKTYAIQVRVIALPRTLRERVKNAQKRQDR